MANEVHVAGEKVEWTEARKPFLAQGYLPSTIWQALDIYDESRLILKTTDPEDFKKANLHDKHGVVIVRQYLKQEEVWIKEEPFAAPDSLTFEQVAEFITNTLGMEIEPWQEELIRIRFEKADSKFKAQGR
jgi:hypothetical protein